MSNRERNEKITDNREITDMEETPKGEDFQVHEDMEELERQRRQLRRERIAVMRQKKRRQELLRSWSLLITAGVIVLVMAAWGVIRLAAGHGPEYGEGPAVKVRKSVSLLQGWGRADSICNLRRNPRRKEIQRTEIL